MQLVEIVFLVLFALAIFVFVLFNRKMVKKVGLVETQLKQTETLYQAHIANLKSQIDSQSQAIAQLPKIIEQQGQHHARFEAIAEANNDLLTHVENLQNSVQLLESQNSEDKLYIRAKKLIELGADIEEVIAECGISKSEAQLLKSLNSAS